MALDTEGIYYFFLILFSYSVREEVSHFTSINAGGGGGGLLHVILDVALYHMNLQILYSS